jgi:asparagine N-glycosylation enzyme membrane subunit Stt3
MLLVHNNFESWSARLISKIETNDNNNKGNKMEDNKMMIYLWYKVDPEEIFDSYFGEMDVDEDEFIYVYDKKTNTLKNKETKEKMFYAQQYKEGPSGKYTNKDDDDITMTFKNGTVTYDNDGDDEQFTYYVYVDKKDVYVVFYGEEFDESDFYDEYHVSGFSFNAKKDKFTIGGTDYKK